MKKNRRKVSGVGLNNFVLKSRKELDMDVSGLRHLNYIFHSKNSWYKYPKYYDP